MSMQSIEDEESLSQRFTYQEKVTGLLILTVTCTYPRSALSLIFLTSLGDTFASKESILPVMYITSTGKKKNLPQTACKKSRYSFCKVNLQAEHIRMQVSDFVSSPVSIISLPEQKCSPLLICSQRSVLAYLPFLSFRAFKHACHSTAFSKANQVLKVGYEFMCLNALWLTKIYSY